MERGANRLVNEKMSSTVWCFFTKVANSKKIACCKACSKNLSYLTTITNLKNHLKHKHPDDYKRLERSASIRRQRLDRLEGLCDAQVKHNRFNSRITNSLWNYFTKMVDSKNIAKCNFCYKQLSYFTSLANLKSHLKLKHPDHYKHYEQSESNWQHQRSSPQGFYEIQDEHGDPLSLPVKPESELSTLEDQECYEEYLILEAPQEVSTPTTTESQINVVEYVKPKKTLDIETIKHIDAMLLKFITRTYLPYSIVEELDFVELLEALNPNYVILRRKIISEKLVPFLYDRCLEDQKRILQQEAVTICLTIESWTSIKKDAFIGITAHFINNEFQFKSVLLKCSVINGAVTSQNISSILRNTCLEWDIFDKIIFCVTDNSTNVIGAISNLGWTHCGCMAHMLNQTLQQPLKILDETLKKVKKIVMYYRCCSKAKENLMEYQAKVHGSSQPLVLVNSAPTRWNSMYSMIERFIHLQDAITITTLNLDVDLPDITSEDWTTLRQLCKVLKPFSEATKELCEDTYVSASKAIAVVNGLKDVMEEVKRKPQVFDTITNVVECIDTQLNNAFKDIEHQKSLALCTILDPRYKISMFMDESAAEAAKTNLIRKTFNLIVTEETGQAPPTSTESLFTKTDNEEISLWRKRNLILEKRRSNVNQNQLQVAQQEVESYLQDEFVDNSCDPCEWWRASGQYKYPNLAKLFRKNNNIVATSVPGERIFSKAGNIVSERKTRLSIKKTEQLVFLNSNMKNSDYLKLIC